MARVGDAPDATGEDAINPLCATRGVCEPGRAGVVGLRPGVRIDPTDLPPGDARGEWPKGDLARGEWPRGDLANGDLASGDLAKGDAVGDAAGDAERGVLANIGDCDAADPGEPTGRRGPGVPGGGGLAGAGPEGGERGGLAPGPDIAQNQTLKSNELCFEQACKLNSKLIP